MSSPYVSVREAARRSHVSRTTLQRAITANRLKLNPDGKLFLPAVQQLYGKAATERKAMDEEMIDLLVAIRHDTSALRKDISAIRLAQEHNTLQLMTILQELLAMRVELIDQQTTDTHIERWNTDHE